MNIDWDFSFRVVGVIVAGGVFVTQVYQSRRQLGNIVSRPRLNLKTDLEILKLLNPSDANYTIVKANVDKLIQTIYQSVRWEEEVGEIRVREEEVGGIMSYKSGQNWQNWQNLSVFLFFSIMTGYLLKDGFSLWAVLTAGYAVVSLFYNFKKISMCLFSLDNVPGKDSKKLLRFLKDDLNVGWAENADISKSDDGQTIYISKDEKKIMMDLKKEKAILKITDVRTHNLKLKREKGKLEITFEKGF